MLTEIDTMEKAVRALKCLEDDDKDILIRNRLKIIELFGKPKFSALFSLTNKMATTYFHVGPLGTDADPILISLSSADEVLRISFNS